MVYDVSEEPNAFIFKDQQPNEEFSHARM